MNYTDQKEYVKQMFALNREGFIADILLMYTENCGTTKEFIIHTMNMMLTPSSLDELVMFNDINEDADEAKDAFSSYCIAIAANACDNLDENEACLNAEFDRKDREDDEKAQKFNRKNVKGYGLQTWN